MISLSQNGTINNRSRNDHNMQQVLSDNQLPELLDRRQRYLHSQRPMPIVQSTPIPRKHASNPHSIVQREATKSRDLKNRFPEFAHKIKNGRQYLFSVSSEDEAEDI